MGEYLSSPKKDKDSIEGSNAQVKFGATGMQGWRKSMEDSHITALDVVDGEVSIFGVFDGHGGCEVAHFVGNHFVDEMKKNENFKKGNYKQALIDVFLLLDKMLLSEAGKKELAKISQKSGSMAQGTTFDGGELAYQAGCTACVAIITKTEVYVGNAGDTRCVIASNGKAKDLSNDHKPDVPNEKRRVQRAGGFVEEGRVNGVIAISRAVGDWEYKNQALKPEDNMVSAYPEVIVEPLRSDHDFMILACDGIWDCLTSQQAVDYVYETKAKLNKRQASVKESPSKSNGTTSTSTSSSGRKSTTSPKKTTKGSSSPGLKGKQAELSGFGLSRTIELMFDKICPTNLAASEGIGTDNMTCILVEFNKQTEQQ